MARFWRRHPSGDSHPLITPEALAHMADLGRARYEGTIDIWDTWPMDYKAGVQQLGPSELQRFLQALLSATESTGGWAICGAEYIVDSAFGPDLAPGSGNAARDAIFASAVDFQREIGVWWYGLSPLEQSFWQRSHPGETWLPEREPPLRAEAQLSALELDYLDDSRNRKREPRDDAEDLYELCVRVGTSVPLPGVWVDPEFEPFLKFPMPRP